MYSDRLLRDCMLDGHAYCFAGHVRLGLGAQLTWGADLTSGGQTLCRPLNRPADKAFSRHERGDASDLDRD